MNQIGLSLKEEQRIIAQCQQDIRQFSLLYRAYVKDIYRYVYMIVRNREGAEDITSQTFLCGIEKLATFKWKGVSIKSWFIKIARNLSYQKFRKEREVPLEEEVSVEAFDESRVDGIAVTDELKDKLQVFIEKLDGITKEIIVLRTWEGYQFNQIAEIVGKKETTVKMRYYRGIRQLQSMAEKDRKAMKLASITPGLIVAGIRGMKGSSEFIAGKAFEARLNQAIKEKSSLFIKEKVMEEVKSQSMGSGDVMSSGAKVGGLSGKVKLSLAVGVSVVLAVVGVGTYVMVTRSTQQEKEGTNTTTGSEASVGEDEQVDSDNTGEGEEKPSEGDEEDVKVADPYEGWKTYTFTKLGFSIMVPEEWVYRGPYNTDPAPVETTTGASFAGNDGSLLLHMEQYIGPHGMCEEDTSEGPKSRNTPWESIMIDGVEFQRSWCGERFIIVKDPMGGTEVPGNVVLFYGLKHYEDIDLLEDVISTVRFL